MVLHYQLYIKVMTPQYAPCLSRTIRCSFVEICGHRPPGEFDDRDEKEGAELGSNCFLQYVPLPTWIPTGYASSQFYHRLLVWPWVSHLDGLGMSALKLKIHDWLMPVDSGS